MDFSLIKKYDIAGPRYTSYPPLPFWQDMPKIVDWFSHIENSFNDHNRREVDLYVHIPYCKKICKYCGCNREKLEKESDLDAIAGAILKECDLIACYLKDVEISSIHFGGGTPNILELTLFKKLLNGIISIFNSKRAEVSMEIDPRIITKEMVDFYYQLGVRRFSFGIQDTNSQIQQAVGREMDLVRFAEIFNHVKKYDDIEINFDFIYGLPLQNTELMKNNIDFILKYLPDTIAMYGFAYVPSFAKNQLELGNLEFATGEEKLKLLFFAKEQLLKNEYFDIGMDHFARKKSSIYDAFKNKTLKRTFMGYTTKKAPVLLGVGPSAISSSGYSYMQNEKNISNYLSFVSENSLAYIKGHTMTELDLEVDLIIQEIMCHGKTKIHPKYQIDLKCFMDDGLVEIRDDILTITKQGHSFLRNICMQFDHRLKKQMKNNLFSRTI